MQQDQHQGNNESPPGDFEAFKSALADRRDRLPRRLAQVAAYAVAHPDEIAFGTASTIAVAAGVQPSTLVRFAQALGYTGFSDLQGMFRDRLRRRWPDYRERIASLRQASEEHGAIDLMEGFTQSSIASLGRLREGVSGQDLDRAADLLAAADTIHLLGLRRSFPVSSYLAYAFGKLDLRCSLVDNVGGLAGEQLAGTSNRDALIAISFMPYAPMTIDLAAKCANHGMPVIAITDSPFSPLAPTATIRFDVVEADFGAFRSMAATFCLAMTLAVATAGRRDPR